MRAVLNPYASDTHTALHNDQALRKIIGENIATRRRALEIKQEDLARIVKLSRSTIQRIESGRTSIGLEYYREFEAALKITDIRILCEEGVFLKVSIRNNPFS